MGRFGAFLRNSGNLKRYMKKLFDAFNADTVEAWCAEPRFRWITMDSCMTVILIWQQDLRLSENRRFLMWQESHIKSVKFGWISIVMHVQPEQDPAEEGQRVRQAAWQISLAEKHILCYTDAVRTIIIHKRCKNIQNENTKGRDQYASFWFNATPDEKKPAECTYTVIRSNENEATIEKPMMILDNKIRKWDHHPAVYSQIRQEDIIRISAGRRNRKWQTS